MADPTSPRAAAAPVLVPGSDVNGVLVPASKDTPQGGLLPAGVPASLPATAPTSSGAVTQGEGVAAPADRIPTAIDTGLQLVDAVRRWDRADVRRALAGADLPALCVVLAAMVNDEASLPDLLRWTEEAEQQQLVDGWLWPEVLAAHAQHELCRTRGVPVPPQVLEGQRVYERVRGRRRRAELRQSA